MTPEQEELESHESRMTQELDDMCASLRRVIESRCTAEELEGFDERLKKFKNRGKILRDIEPCKTE